MLLSPCAQTRGTGSSSRNDSSELCFLAPIDLECGDRIEAPQVSFQLVGPAQAPVVLVLGGISASNAVCERPEFQQNGWWTEVVGPARAIDTRRFRVLSLEYLGGNGATSGPRNSPAFPRVTTGDQALLIARLLNHLGIQRLHAIVGASFGGMVGLRFAVDFADHLERLVVLCAAHKPSATALANRILQRKIVQLAKGFGQAQRGLELARALAMISYRTDEAFQSRFLDSAIVGEDENGFRFEIGDYLFHQGQSFAKRFHQDAFLRLSEAIDLHRIAPERIHAETDLIAFTSDRLIPLEDMRELHAGISGPAQLHELDSLYGHDGFLKEYRQLAPILGAALDREVCA